MSFLDHYNLRGLRRILKSTSSDLDALKEKVDNLANITLKNNLADQQAAGLQVTKTPTSNNDVIRKTDFDSKFTWNSLLSDWTGNPNTQNLIFTFPRNKLTVGKYYIVSISISGSGWKIQVPFTLNYESNAQSGDNIYISPVQSLVLMRNSETVQTFPNQGIYYVIEGVDNNNMRLKIMRVGTMSLPNSSTFKFKYKEL